MRYGRDSGAERAVSGDDEVYQGGGGWVYGGTHSGIHGCGRCGVDVDVRLGLVDSVWD